MDFVGVGMNESVPCNDVVLEKGDNGGGLFEELMLEELGHQARLSVAEVLDEAEELGGVGRGVVEGHSHLDLLASNHWNGMR